MHELDNAPERLWLSAPDIDNEHDVWFDADEGGTEYVRADLATATSAGVTEEQTPRVKQLEWATHFHGRTDEVVSLTADLPGLVGAYKIEPVTANTNFRLFIEGTELREPEIHYWPLEAAKAVAQADFEKRILAALEASRVAPVSQKEAVAATMYGEFKPISVGVGTAVANAVDRQLASSGLKSLVSDPSPAPAGEPVGIKALEWKKAALLTNWQKQLIVRVTDTVLGRFSVCQAAATVSGPLPPAWIGPDGVHHEVADVEAGMAAVEAHYERVIRSALHPTPTPVSEPVGVVEALKRVTDHLEEWARYHSDERTAETDAAIYCARQELASLRSPAVVEGK